VSRRRAPRAAAAGLALLVLVAVALPFVPSSRAGAGGVGQATEAVLLTRASSSPVDGLETGVLHVPDLGGGAHEVRVGVVHPEGEPVADVLFVHGHADRLDNHAALFAGLRGAGVRVISFDLPSHGLTDAGPIDVWTSDDLADLVARVERATADGDRPLVLAGWSFGGLVATRIAQDEAQTAAFSRPLAGLVLEVPAIAPRPAAGGDGISRLRALTHDPHAPVAGPPRPASPLLDPVFAGRLLTQAAIAAATPLPRDLPTLVELSDPAEDLYVDVDAVERWALGIARDDGARPRVMRCDGGRHGLDLEAWPIGAGARLDLVEFVVDVAVGVDPRGEGQDASVSAASPPPDEAVRGACR